MSKDWNTYKLGELSDIIMGQSPKGETTNKDGNGIPLLNGPTEFEFSYPSPTQFTVDPKKISEIGDLLFCVRGSTTGKMNFSDQSYAIGRGIGVFRGKNGYSTKFVKYVIDLYLAKMLALCTGSTFPNLSKTDLENFKVQSCDALESNRIASILSAIDDKIELNLQMNKTLEEMAMALYKHWFVDFGPFQSGEFVDSELGMIPKGWEVKSILDIAELLSGGTPKTTIPEYWDGGINWVSAKDIGNGGAIYINDTEKTITEGGVKNSSTKILPEDTVILVARGSVGKYGMIAKPMTMNQSCYGLYTKSDFSQGLVYLMFSNLISQFQRMAYGSVFDTITTSTFNSTKVISPPQKIVRQLNDLIDPLFLELKRNIIENQTLTTIRDTLLPKLISGEVRIKETEKILEEAL